MLARLQSLPEVSKAYVELTGRHFLLIPESGSLSSETIAGVLDALGPGSNHVEAGREQAEISDFESVGLWLDCGSLIKLSLLEARILAAHWGAVAAREAMLDGKAADSLVEFLRIELSEEFRAIHDEGGTTDRGWYAARFALAVDRCLQRMRGATTQEQSEVLRASLLRFLDRPDSCQRD